MVAEKGGVIKMFDLRSGKIALSLNCPENLVQVRRNSEEKKLTQRGLGLDCLTFYRRTQIGTQLTPNSSALQLAVTSGTFGRAVGYDRSS